MVKVGSRFQKIFEEAKQHPAYWMEDLRLQFLNDIYEIMQEQKLAQKDLAEKMGVSEAYISKGFNGSEASQDCRLLQLQEQAVSAGAESGGGRGGFVAQGRGNFSGRIYRARNDVVQLGVDKPEGGTGDGQDCRWGTFPVKDRRRH